MAQTKAQTKKRSAPKRAKPSAKAKGKAKSPSSKPKAAKASKPKVASSSNPGGSNGSIGSRAAKVASKAKVPLVAGGAAIAGAAGGMALAGSKRGRKSGVVSALTHKPRIEIKSRDVAKAAKEVGNFGAQVGELAHELHQARETANGKKHRSPIEVVLQGLTARR